MSGPWSVAGPAMAMVPVHRPRLPGGCEEVGDGLYQDLPDRYTE
jgi:hypothetical protein